MLHRMQPPAQKPIRPGTLATSTAATKLAAAVAGLKAYFNGPNKSATNRKRAIDSFTDAFHTMAESLPRGEGSQATDDYLSTLLPSLTTLKGLMDEHSHDDHGLRHDVQHAAQEGLKHMHRGFKTGFFDALHGASKIPDNIPSTTRDNLAAILRKINALGTGPAEYIWLQLLLKTNQDFYAASLKAGLKEGEVLAHAHLSHHGIQVQHVNMQPFSPNTNNSFRAS